jgi:uncharacterized LabA/DUF88 family protein
VRTEPDHKRTIAFIDGQNLFHAAREAFGYSYPNYDVRLLASTLCAKMSWDLEQVRFYTGVPDASDDSSWYAFWMRKLAMMGRQSIVTYARPLRYRIRTVRLPDSSEHSYLAGEEKGIDVRIALDIIRMAHQKEYDVALLFSQDQDLSEVADEIRTISRMQKRWIKIASAFPWSASSKNKRGVNSTDWIPIDRVTYEACLDRRDYFSRR